MHPDTPAFLEYQRARFSARLPMGYLYTSSHLWLARQADGVWRVGLTKFATRMLGEMVDHGFGVVAGAPVRLGQIVGWIEGFKAISDLYCVAEGTFAGGNPLLLDKLSAVHHDPLGEGWLYLVRGTPDPAALQVKDYAGLLDQTIDRILERQQGPE